MKIGQYLTFRFFYTDHPYIKIKDYLQPKIVFYSSIIFNYPQWKYLCTRASISMGFPSMSARNVLSS